MLCCNNEINALSQKLYELGARRVLVTGTGPLGCVPAELAMHSQNGECATELQRAVNLFNPQLVQLLHDLNTEIGSDVFISANAFAMHLDFVSNPQAYGTYMSLTSLFLCDLTFYSFLIFLRSTKAGLLLLRTLHQRGNQTYVVLSYA